ncbi:hypothetical protein [Cryobacterium sp. PH29-G1]|uniref:hypothetical protein n=1 Tax=Cryobacterium sp. PH29-G1 TaxID=3046211 RepID=UPI0024B9F25B|nr:hypothetical protein [Cryobacterium sp. PH29-G1]MDJ0349103.1 hypothetical protein [Cryobacterium sp. PH29-G1]
MRAAGRIIVLAAACAALLPACAGPGQSDARIDAGSGSGVTAAPDNGDTAADLVTADPGRADPGIADPGTAGPRPPGPAAPDDPGAEGTTVLWLPIGPVSPSDPPPNFWYSLLQNRDCELLAANDTSADPLWSAASALCTAVVTDNAQDWTRGTTQLTAVPAPAATDCLGRAVYTTLTAIAEAHRRNPAERLDPVAPGAGTACPLGLDGVSSSGINSPDPDPHTSVCGGAELLLAGRFLVVDRVEVGGRSVDVRRAGENSFFFITPASSSGVQEITAWGPDGRLPGTATITVDGDPATCSATGSGQ